MIFSLEERQMKQHDVHKIDRVNKVFFSILILLESGIIHWIAGGLRPNKYLSRQFHKIIFRLKIQTLE